MNDVETRSESQFTVEISGRLIAKSTIQTAPVHSTDNFLGSRTLVKKIIVKE